MANKTLNNFVVAGTLTVTSGGAEVQTGDTVTLFLDQTRNASFPESITALVVGSVKSVNVAVGNCPTEGRSYNLQYEVDDLEGAADHLDVCDIADVVSVSCCTVNADAITAINAALAALPEVLELHNEILQLSGGGADALDGQNLEGVGEGVVWVFLLSADPLVLETYRVEVSDDATNSPEVIRAADWVPTTGKVFRRVTCNLPDQISVDAVQLADTSQVILPAGSLGLDDNNQAVIHDGATTGGNLISDGSGSPFTHHINTKMTPIAGPRISYKLAGITIPAGTIPSTQDGFIELTGTLTITRTGTDLDTTARRLNLCINDSTMDVSVIKVDAESARITFLGWIKIATFGVGATGYIEAGNHSRAVNWQATAAAVDAEANIWTDNFASPADVTQDFDLNLTYVANVGGGGSSGEGPYFAGDITFKFVGNTLPS